MTSMGTQEVASAGREKQRDCTPTNLVGWLDPRSDFNFEHYRLRHMVAELLRGFGDQFVLPGSEAPDFELTSTKGERVRLSQMRGRPVLLHFVSYTCPVTRGGMRIMKELFGLYGDRVQFIEILVRQAHPGERHGAYRSDEQKMADAQGYQAEESIAWPVVVDDLDGSIQRAYGGTAASAYLIDSEGRVAFCGVWGQSPLLTEAVEDLLARGGSGAPAGKGVDRLPHLGAAIVHGRRGPASGGRRALIDLELGFPGATLLMGLGSAARPILGPLVLRTAPLPKRTRNLLIATALGLTAALFAATRFGCKRCNR